ncbi:MAG TPA: thioredoxin family protein [Prolixibacteraceae bacterium]|nr:thioredoxin family protein [Prolixibacteraceae bacterium]
MKLLFAFFVLPLLINGSIWVNNLEQAEQKARTENKFIMLNFSGSDWCGPCIRMHKEIFDNEEFLKYTNDHLVMVNADFPRMKKDQLPKDLQKSNDALAEKYNSEGSFPCTLLLDSNGKVIYTWKGFYNKGAESFTYEVKQFVESHQTKQ